ncbi:MAG TPA: hypothetical protein PKC45_16635, partial [Gemmatales bacterium]|nr:hypothetical protein [Gemmatales bacterium]
TLHALLVDQQHFDLAGDVVPDLEFLDEITPLLLLWDNHDIPVVKTHGLVFETRVGQGRLLISALRHGGPENAAGQRLLELWRWHLVHGSAPRNALTSATIERLRGELREKRLSLVGQLWRFKPDPNDIGVAERWATTPLDESWKPIKIGQHWEGQGYPNLDGWAWYRLEVTIPAEWPEQDYHLHCEGLDDYGEFFVDGRLIGTMGDRENRKTAFEDRASPPLKGLRPGARVTLAVRVYDWYGAGGLHRPLTLSTEPLRGTRRLLR